MVDDVKSKGRPTLTGTIEALAGPDRGSQRPELRDDPRERAKKRTAELLAHGNSLDEGSDEFYIDPAIIPEGWDYEWKTYQVLGATNPAYEVSMARGGWEPVPASRHPEMMPPDWKEAVIVRKGMKLCERPMEVTEASKDLMKRRAKQQVKSKEEQLNERAVPEGFTKDNKGASLVKVKRSYEPMAVPEK